MNGAFFSASGDELKRLSEAYAKRYPEWKLKAVNTNFKDIIERMTRLLLYATSPFAMIPSKAIAVMLNHRLYPEVKEIFVKGIKYSDGRDEWRMRFVHEARRKVNVYRYVSGKVKK